MGWLLTFKRMPLVSTPSLHGGLNLWGEMMAEFPGATDCFVDESRVFPGQNDHKAIVLHGTGGSPTQTDIQLGAYFESTPLETSVHYGIDRTGAIAQYVHEADGAGGNGILDPGHDPFWDQYSDNPNWHTLSVETENDLTNSLPLTDPQKATLFKLVAYWVAKYNIPLSNIKGHFTLEPVNRANCPGPNFPEQEMLNYLNGVPMAIDLTTPGVSTYFDGSSTIWHCKQTGFLVGNAILSFYQNFGGDALCGLTYLGLPVSNEIAVPGHPGVTIQEFERGCLCYDPGHTLDSPPQAGPVYLIHVEQDPRYVLLQGEIAQLKTLPAVATLTQINNLVVQAGLTLTQIAKMSQVQ